MQLIPVDEAIIVLTLRRWVKEYDLDPYIVTAGVATRDPSTTAHEVTKDRYGIRNHCCMQVTQLVLTIQETATPGDGILTRLRDLRSTR